MAQWMDLQRIEKFVNHTRLYRTCEKSGGLHLVELGLTAGWLADKIWARLKFDFLLCLAEVLHCLAEVLHCFSNFDAFITLFPGKNFYKVVL